MAIAGRVAIVPKGDWSADATYKRLDAVTYNNTLYFAKKDVPAGMATSNTEYWSKSIVGSVVTVDDALSSTSTNPVQNKVVKAYVDENVDFSTSTSKSLHDTVEAPLVLNEATRNLLNPTLQTTTKNGVTCTNNGDGTYTLNGTATDNVFFDINTNIPINKGTEYKAVCFKDEDYVPNKIISCVRRVDRNHDYVYNNGSFVSDTENCWLFIEIAKGVTVSNLVAKPMITTDLDATYDDFVLYSGYDIKTCGKNLLNPTLKTTTINGVTISNNGYGTYTLQGTSTNHIWSALRKVDFLEDGVTYKLVGCPPGGSTYGDSGTYNIYIPPKTGSVDMTDTGNGVKFNSTGYIGEYIMLWIAPNVTLNNIVIKPMITTDLNSTYDEYEPYKDGGTVHIDSTTEFPLLGLKSFDGETNIISPGNVEVTYAKSDSGAAILYTSEKSVKDARKDTTVNLLKPTLQTTTLNGVTCTNNGDGTYTLNGTATDNVRFQFGIDDNLIVGKTYKALGIPISGSFSTVLMEWDNHGYFNKDGLIDKKTSEPRPISMQVLSGYTCDNLVFKPMLTTNLSATYDDFVPYTGDTGSLNGDVAELKAQSVKKDNVVNNLTTTEEGFVLDGRQGKALQDQITSLNGSLNNRLAVPRFTTTNETTLSDIKNYINENMNAGLSYMQIYDEKGKFFNTSGNWLLVAFAQNDVIGCLLAVNHWSNEVKVISTYEDSSGNRKLKISNVTTTDTKDV